MPRVLLVLDTFTRLSFIVGIHSFADESKDDRFSEST